MSRYRRLPAADPSAERIPYADTWTAPKRIQRRRTKGWRMPKGAMYVGRPSLWGNPWSIANVRAMYDGVPRDRVSLAAAAVRLYQGELEHFGLLSEYSYMVSDALWERLDYLIRGAGFRNMGEAAVILRGRDLVCWCPLDQPCHADVLLELANR